jgi:ribosome-binding protein aMBF1 (putative translation factor)
VVCNRTSGYTWDKQTDSGAVLHIPHKPLATPSMTKEDNMILADKIIDNRKKNGWSQEELADKLGVSRQSVSKWEGAQSIPDMKKILQLADLFGVTTDYLLKDEIEFPVMPEQLPVR